MIRTQIAVTTDDPREYLRTYAETYLVQEIQAEALTRNLGAFARFLETAARRNARVTNTTGIARDAGPGLEPGLEAVSYYDPPNMTYPFGAYVCVVDVDTGVTDVFVEDDLAAQHGAGPRGQPRR